MVRSIWRYPLKSAQGEQVTVVVIGPRGVEGDRAWACVALDGRVASAKNPRRWGRLLGVLATLETTRQGTRVLVRVPGRAPLVAGTAEADHTLSEWLGEEVRLRDRVPEGARLSRWWPEEAGMVPDWATGSRAGSEETTPIAGAEQLRRFVDFGALHLVTSAELDRLRADGVAAEVRRFRPNLVVDLDGVPKPGDRLLVGAEIVLRVQSPTPRCAIPGAAQPGLERAPELLRALARQRVEVPGLGRAACLGTYAEVVRGGTVRVGDRVSTAA